MRIKSITLEKALSKYLSSVSILKKGYEAEAYRIKHLQQDPLSQLIMKDITSVDIASYRDRRLSAPNSRTGKAISNATVRLELSLLSNVFDVGRIEWGYCSDNPVKNVRKPKPAPGRDRRLTPREERLIFRYAHAFSNQELYSIIVLALETAMRQGEILGLLWENINLRSRIAHLPDTKNGTKRDVPLSLKARDALIRMGVQNKGPVFNYTSRGLKSTWRFMREKLGIEDLHFHDLRHESVSRFFELGSMDMMEIAAISGHKSLSMLKRYTHLKATSLVRKLEGNKHKGRQVVIDHLIPYPARLFKHDEGDFHVQLLDFDELIVSAHCEFTAIRAAQDALLREIMNLIKDSKAVPPPDHYLEIIDDRQLIMIDPMNTIHA